MCFKLKLSFVDRRRDWTLLALRLAHLSLWPLLLSTNQPGRKEIWPSAAMKKIKEKKSKEKKERQFNREQEKSRNSCMVKVGGVDVEGMMDWSTCVRLEDTIACIALPVLQPDLELPLPATAGSVRPHLYFWGGSFIWRTPVVPKPVWTTDSRYDSMRQGPTPLVSARDPPNRFQIWWYASRPHTVGVYMRSPNFFNSYFAVQDGLRCRCLAYFPGICTM